MERRKFLVLVGAAFSQVAQAQQPPAGPRRIGVLMNLGADDPEGQVRLKTFLQQLQTLGWFEGKNLHVNICWGEGKAERFRSCAADLVKQAPDVVLAGSGATMPALMEATRSLPIVFVQTVDPVASGYVASLARPDSNATGFTQFEFSTAGKWLELLKQMAPRLTRVAVLRGVDVEGTAQFAAIQSAATSFGVELTSISARNPSEIEHGVGGFAGMPDRGLIVTAGAHTAVHRDLIIALVARYKLPAIYPFRYFVTSGGLISYGPDPIEPYQRAAEYAHRILNGEKPGNLPVQAASKFELVINLKTAKALSLSIPPTVIARADEAIE